MFESLSTKLQNITKSMRGKARVTDQDIKDMMREIRMALLEADVNYTVVKSFVADMTEKCKNADIEGSFTPGQQIVKIVRDSLVELLGEGETRINVSPSGFTVLILYGLQGAGKTTTAVKLANILKKDGKKPMVASVDVHRPAAAKQLQVLAEANGIPCYIDPDNKDAVKIANDAMDKAKYMLCNYLIVDTAGRTVVDDEMMTELKALNDAVDPDEKLLVVDAMIGQEAVNVAQSFEEAIGMDGFIMTKLDGDARGGAALSIRKITGKPIKYICVGEKTDAIEQFYPNRMADRILGMGDILTLIEKVQENLDIDEDKEKETFNKLKKGKFDFEDYLDSMSQMKKMGGLSGILSMMPGMFGGLKNSDIEAAMDESKLSRIEAIVLSMTPAERRDPDLLNPSRKNRIAKGAGVDISEVNRFIKQFEQSRKMMKQMPSLFGGPGGKRGKFRLPF